MFKKSNGMAVTSKNDILSAIAYWGIRQSPYWFPGNLEKALSAVSEEIDKMEIFESSDKSAFKTHKKITTEEIETIVKHLIFDLPEIAIWNVTNIEQYEGITDPNDPKRTIKHAFTSRTGAWQTEDRDFIDLDALHRNVYNHLIKDKDNDNF